MYKDRRTFVSKTNPKEFQEQQAEYVARLQTDLTPVTCFAVAEDTTPMSRGSLRDVTASLSGVAKFSVMSVTLNRRSTLASDHHHDDEFCFAMFISNYLLLPNAISSETTSAILVKTSYTRSTNCLVVVTIKSVVAKTSRRAETTFDETLKTTSKAGPRLQ